MPYAGRFDGFHAVPASVSKTCLVRFDNNKYSVIASAVGRPVEIRAYADRLRLLRRTAVQAMKLLARFEQAAAERVADSAPQGLDVPAPRAHEYDGGAD